MLPGRLPANIPVAETIALADAERFAPGLQGRGGNGVPCPVLASRSRGATGVWALGQRNIWFRYRRVCEELQPLCDDLNELVDALRSPWSPPSSAAN